MSDVFALAMTGRWTATEDAAGVTLNGPTWEECTDTEVDTIRRMEQSGWAPICPELPWYGPVRLRWVGPGEPMYFDSEHTPDGAGVVFADPWALTDGGCLCSHWAHPGKCPVKACGCTRTRYAT